ncbi:MAG: two-component system sensor histidine kinase NtrB [Candidatus Eiseniibacteriota bacterium]
MRRSFALTVSFALAVIAVTAAASWFTYGRVRAALEDEFARRVEWAAAAGAADVQPRQVMMLRRFGRAAFATADSLLLSLGSVRRSSQAARVLLFDLDGTLLFDTEADSLVGRPSAVYAAHRDAIERAQGGAPSHSALYRASAAGGTGGTGGTGTGDAGRRRFLMGFAPVRDPEAPPVPGSPAGGPVIAVLAVESSAEFLAVLPEIARLLVTTALLAALAVLLLAAFFLRVASQQQQLERSLSRAENLASVGELAATLAHEVRNPLGVIQGAADRLEKHYQGPERELFDYIRTETDRLSNTVRRYLEFARPSPPGDGADVVASLDATLGLLAREAEMRRVTIVREGESAGARVRMGGEELKQVLFNLVRNAVEALPEGGTVRVGWASDRRDIVLHVRDDGPGMSAETLARVRRPFVTTRAQGTGLGLAIVDRLVREAGGRFDLTSTLGRGTEARVRLPRAGGAGGAGGAEGSGSEKETDRA